MADNGIDCEMRKWGVPYIATQSGKSSIITSVKVPGANGSTLFIGDESRTVTGTVIDEKGKQISGTISNVKFGAGDLLGNGPATNSAQAIAIVAKAMNDAGVECKDPNGKVVAPVISTKDFLAMNNGQVIRK